MPKDNKLDQLSQVRLFSALSKRELTRVGRASDEVTVPAGKEIVAEGSTGHEFFLILDGTAVVKKNGRKVATLSPGQFFLILDGTAVVKKNGRKVATLGPGQYFGELALLVRRPRNATVAAETDMELLVLGQREFSGLLDEVPGLAHKLLSTMATRLADADAKAVSH